MAISQSRYVLITSAVGGQARVGNRELIARVMTTNILAPTGGVLEFGGGASTALKNVGAYFGVTSNEYAFAKKYFNWVSKNATQAYKISFARYTPEATAPQLVSMESLSAVNDIAQVTSGGFHISMGGVSTDITSLDFSSATSYADVASVIQTGIRAYTTGNTMFTSATVAYNNGSFIITGGNTGAGAIVALSAPASGTDISSMIGLSAVKNPVVSAGTAAETPASAMGRVSDISNNFASFTFIESLSVDNIKAVAEWCAGKNVMYVYSQACTPLNYSSVQEAVKGIEGCVLTLDAHDNYAQYMAMVPAACIDYNKPNAAINFMYQQFDGDVPSVTSDTDADKYDALKINYLGATQQAGKNISFYQRGYLQGENIVDLGVYYNEIWLKDSFITEFMNLLLALNQLPANEDGANLAKGVMIPVIEQAKTNGVISVGKSLSSTQKAYITQLTGDAEAWREVEQNGCYLTVSVQSYVDESGVTSYKFNYLLVYAKGDSIRLVTGNDVLI